MSVLGSRISDWRARNDLSIFVREQKIFLFRKLSTGSEVQSASYSMDTVGFLPGR